MTTTAERIKYWKARAKLAASRGFYDEATGCIQIAETLDTLLYVERKVEKRVKHIVEQVLVELYGS